METNYGWLVFSLLLMVVWGIVFLRRKDLRSEMLLASLIFLIFGVAGDFYYNDYWLPFHVTKLFGLDIGIEDFLYTFAIAGLGAVSYEFFFRKVHRKERKAHNVELNKIEVLLSGTSGLSVFLFLDHLTDWNLIVTSGIGLTFIGIFIGYFRKDLIKPLIINALVFATLVILLEIVTDILIPGFSRLWIDSATMGIKLFNFPIEELIFHFGWGMGLGSLFEMYFGLKDK